MAMAPDEMFVKINDEQHSLWRAGDHEGEVLESFVTKTDSRPALLQTCSHPSDNTLGLSLGLPTFALSPQGGLHRRDTALHLLDDRVQVFNSGLGALVNRGQTDDLGLQFRLIRHHDDNHRLQRVDVVRKSGRAEALLVMTSTKAHFTRFVARFLPPESLRYGLSDRGWTPSPFDPDARPVHALDKRHQLWGSKPDHAVLDPQPVELVVSLR
jgi:hypothetical protein